MTMYGLKYFLIILTGSFISFGMIILIISIYYNSIFGICMSIIFFFFGVLSFFLIFSKYYVRSNIFEEEKRLKNNIQDYYNKKLNKVLEDSEIKN